MEINLSASDNDLVRMFRSLQSREDIADLLEISDDQLKYYLYIRNPHKRYTEFQIPKSTGGYRDILAPNTGLKIIQQKLAYILSLTYEPRAPVHGFVNDKSILTNAKMHLRKHNVLNLDLFNFFPSINFGRVRGLFIAMPYKLEPPVATVLAQICCHNDQIPQGAPTSPILSNMICSKMDSQLRILAKDNRCTYTRYADDITFSTTVRSFPISLADILPDGGVRIGKELEAIIEENGFEINYKKVRLQTKYRRQEVTGITVNEFPNVTRKFVRQIRAMLHDWQRNGHDIAQQRHYDLFDKKHRPDFKDPPPFFMIVKGKIDYLGMVKGKEDPNYLTFLYSYAQLNPDYQLRLEPVQIYRPGVFQANIFTEGKTDWRHLKAAHRSFQRQGRFTELQLRYREEDDIIGDDSLWRMCEAYAKSPDRHPVTKIFLFDRDNHSILKKAKLENSLYHDHGKNVFAVTLPIPPHRQSIGELCTELLYKNEDLFRKDRNGRRIFLSNEFHPISHRHKYEDLSFAHTKPIDDSKITILDLAVYDISNRNVALTKNDFAQNVLDAVDEFQNIDFSGFEGLFDLIREILKKAYQ